RSRVTELVARPVPKLERRSVGVTCFLRPDAPLWSDIRAMGRPVPKPKKSSSKPKAAVPQATNDAMSDATSDPTNVATAGATTDATKTVIAAGPVEVQVDSGEVAVVVAPPAPAGIDRRLFNLINDLPHSSTSDRYVSVLSDLGEGLGWV